MDAVDPDLPGWIHGVSLVGGEPMKITADQFFRASRPAFMRQSQPPLAANYPIEVTGDRAEVWAHGYAWNRVPALPAGADLWETWGNYRLSFRRVAGQWRLDAFRVLFKHTRGNDAVRTRARQALSARDYRPTARLPFRQVSRVRRTIAALGKRR